MCHIDVARLELVVLALLIEGFCRCVEMFYLVWDLLNEVLQNHYDEVASLRLNFEIEGPLLISVNEKCVLTSEGKNAPRTTFILLYKCE
jgi:hypothetical protein